MAKEAVEVQKWKQQCAPSLLFGRRHLPKALQCQQRVGCLQSALARHLKQRPEVSNLNLRRPAAELDRAGGEGLDLFFLHQYLLLRGGS
jgi:hypothetical protein